MEWLIDVIDADGDGTVSRSELVRRCVFVCVGGG
ncbi:MAG: hypothetical protein RLZZ221_2355, partial [Verrucomicrobiota bacterium]